MKFSRYGTFKRYLSEYGVTWNGFLSRRSVTCVPQGHLREGKCHLSLGNAMAAIRCFQKVLELEPSNREAHKEVNNPDFICSFFIAPKSYYCKDNADNDHFVLE